MPRSSVSRATVDSTTPADDSSSTQPVTTYEVTVSRALGQQRTMHAHRVDASSEQDAARAVLALFAPGSVDVERVEPAVGRPAQPAAPAQPDPEPEPSARQTASTGSRPTDEV